MDDSLTPLLLGLGMGKEVLSLEQSIVMGLIILVILLVLANKNDPRDS